MKTSQTTASRTRLILVLISGAALILTVILARRCGIRSIPLVDPIVSVERQDQANPAQSKPLKAPPSLPDDGEVYRTAERLRDASALALAASLYAANERLNRHIVRSNSDLIAAVASAGLLPPGVATNAPAMLLSDHSTLLLRFRPDPLAIEVLSFPLTRDDGPALMVRIPALSDDGTRGSVFIADRLGDISPPAPFASLADCVSAGWIDQSFSEADMPQAQDQQLRAWLAAKHLR